MSTTEGFPAPLIIMYRLLFSHLSIALINQLKRWFDRDDELDFVEFNFHLFHSDADRRPEVLNVVGSKFFGLAPYYDHLLKVWKILQTR